MASSVQNKRHGYQCTQEKTWLTVYKRKDMASSVQKKRHG